MYHLSFIPSYLFSNTQRERKRDWLEVPTSKDISLIAGENPDTKSNCFLSIIPLKIKHNSGRPWIDFALLYFLPN